MPFALVRIDVKVIGTANAILFNCKPHLRMVSLPCYIKVNFLKKVIHICIYLILIVTFILHESLKMICKRLFYIRLYQSSKEENETFIPCCTGECPNQRPESKLD